MADILGATEFPQGEWCGLAIVFVPYPAFGHVNPMVAVMAELVGRGVAVRALVNRRHAPAVLDVGAQVTIARLSADVYVPAGRTGLLRYAVGRVRKPLAGLVAARSVAVMDRPRLVVVDPMMPAADRAARRRGMPTAVFSTTYATRLDQRLMLVNALSELQPNRAVGADAHFLGPLVRREPDTDLGRFGLPTDGPLLLVSAGTVFARTPAFFRAVARAFAGSPWQVVMATGPVPPEAIGPLPVNVVAARYVPQLALLAHATVFLTHAGMNSTLEALSLGVPMVVSPRAGDQRFLARRLVELGVAVRAPRRTSAIRDVVESAAASPTLNAEAARWRGRIGGRSTVSTAADLLMARAGY